MVLRRNSTSSATTSPGKRQASSNPIYCVYDSGDKLWALKYTDGNTYFYVRNAQGDIIKIVNSSGTVVVEYAYDAWGKSMGVTGSMASTLGVDNPFRYRGYYYDEETGLYYLNQRYYNSELGRFINMDTLLGINGKILSHNLFAYCVNNPVMLSDPSGNFPWTQQMIQEKRNRETLNKIKSASNNSMIRRKIDQAISNVNGVKWVEAKSYQLTHEQAVHRYQVKQALDATTEIVVGVGVGALVSYATGGLGGSAMASRLVTNVDKLAKITKAIKFGTNVAATGGSIYSAWSGVGDGSDSIPEGTYTDFTAIISDGYSLFEISGTIGPDGENNLLTDISFSKL